MFAFVLAYHIALVALLPAFINVFSWTAVVFFLVTYILGGMSITVGYHRLYAHKAYSANPFFEWLLHELGAYHGASLLPCVTLLRKAPVYFI